MERVAVRARARNRGPSKAKALRRQRDPPARLEAAVRKAVRRAVSEALDELGIVNGTDEARARKRQEVINVAIAAAFLASAVKRRHEWQTLAAIGQALRVIGRQRER